MREHFKDSYKQIERVQAETAEEAGDDAQGHLSKELFVGDLVLVRREPNVRREGPLRFQSRVYPLVYKILKKISRHTFVVGDVADPKRELPFVQPLNAERLVKIDMPELDLDAAHLRRVDIYDSMADVWRTWEIERFSADGRVFVKDLLRPANREWIDLATKRYRWVYYLVDVLEDLRVFRDVPVAAHRLQDARIP